MGDPLGSPRVAPHFLPADGVIFARVVEAYGFFSILSVHRGMCEGFGVFGVGFGRSGGAQGVANGTEGGWGDPRLVRHKGNKHGKYFGCDHTSTNAPDPIRTPQLSVLGRE